MSDETDLRKAEQTRRLDLALSVSEETQVERALSKLSDEPKHELRKTLEDELREKQLEPGRRVQREGELRDQLERELPDRLERELPDGLESERRRVLRPHWEDPVTNQRDIDLRQGFDAALNQLAALELAVSTGYLLLKAAKAKIDPRMLKLLTSRAVSRFIDDYDYFQVRFLANRLKLEEFKLPAVTAPEPPTRPEDAEAMAVERFLKEPITSPKEPEQSQSPQVQPNVPLLYRFLDDYTFKGIEKGCQHDRFRLWLEDDGTEHESEVLKYFNTLKLTVAHWALERSKSYFCQSEAVQARFAIFDIYWLLKLFNTEISTSGDVTYCGTSWITLVEESLHLVPKSEEEKEFQNAKRTLRRALGLACDWIRGEAVEESAPGVARGDGKHPPVAWVDAFKDELNEIFKHRGERHLLPEPKPEPFAVRHGLTGLAFSGGGIRSATFNLGVLEALKANDLLRFVDYLSTVSGGGYIGGWLVANAKRRGYWIRREADWRDSIKHLRDYSNYLSPHLGFMSPDTWTMWTTFLRNTILVQLQLFLAIAACLLLPYLLRFVFNWLLKPGGQMVYLAPEVLSAILMFVVTVLVCASLLLPRTPVRKGCQPASGWSRWGIRVAVFAFVLSSLSVTAVIWRAAQRLLHNGHHSYGDILRQVARSVISSPAMVLVLVGCYLALTLLAFASAKRTGADSNEFLQARGFRKRVIEFLRHVIESANKHWAGMSLPTRWAAGLAPAGALAALLLAVSALILLLQSWVSDSQGDGYGHVIGLGVESAFVLGPTLVMAVVCLSVFMLIGMLGRSSDRQPREWWSRFGALLSMTGAAWLLLSVAAVYSPHWLEEGLRKLAGLGWIPILGWLATSAGSVFAGSSGATSGEGSGQDAARGGASKTSPALEALAVAGPFVAIAGIVVAISAALHAVLLQISLDFSPLGGDCYWEELGAIKFVTVAVAFLIVLAASLLLAWRVDINIFSLSEFYRLRLVRCYLGATRYKRSPHPFTGFDEKDDLALASVRTPTSEAVTTAEAEEAETAPFAGPFPIVNCTLNLGGSSDLSVKTRQSDSFSMTPLHCGYNYKPKEEDGERVGGYSPTRSYFGKQGPTLGLAVAVSGAAANPNMGYHTSPLTSFLMTAFNARLGCWFPNPAQKTPVGRFSPYFALRSLSKELFGTASDEAKFVDVSDGGHFENLGVYELVRRRCRLIIASDAECDPDINFESLGNLIRICQVDFGAKINIDVSSIRPDPRTGRSKSHCAVGRIEYGNGGLGTLIYIKASLLDEENTSVLQYRSGHATFPHETTANQFFTEDQFESYRQLGYDCAKRTFRDAALKSIEDEELEKFADQLTDIWTPAKNVPASFISSTTALSALWKRLGQDPHLEQLSNEIITHTPPKPWPPVSPNAREFYFCNEMIQLMENVHLDLKLDDTFDDPDNAGWKDLFMKCSRSATFRFVWEKSHNTYGKRFQYFCKRKLNLELE